MGAGVSASAPVGQGGVYSISASAPVGQGGVYNAVPL